MVANPARRNHLADAGLDVLAELGARGLTHRAVDTRADEPPGTTSNYFRTREALLGALAERIFERLQPDPDVLAAAELREPTVDLYVDHMDDIVHRVTQQPNLWISLLELRLEATRSPALAASLQRTLNSNFANDLAHHRSSGLPGGDESVLLLHHAMNGIILDALTPSLSGPLDRRQSVRALVERLTR